MSEWKTGYAALVGTTGVREIEATPRVAFKYRWTDDDDLLRLDVERLINVGPCERSVICARLAIFDEAEGGREVAWFQPPPGAGMVGTLVLIEPNQAVNETEAQ